MGLLPLEFTDALQDSPYFRFVVTISDNYSDVNPSSFQGQFAQSRKGVGEDKS